MASDQLKEQLRKFAVGEHITLFEIDTSPVGGQVYYVTNHVFEERVPIRFNGRNYVQISCDMSKIDVDAQGAPAQPNFSISTSGGPMPALIQQYNDLKRCIVRRYVTFSEYLDLMPDPDNEGEVIANPTADGSARIKEELYIINRKTAADDVYAEFELKSPMDMDGVKIPLRIIRKRWCDAKYRVPDGNGGFVYFPVEDGGCPYTGGACFDVAGNPTTPANDRCSKEMETGCVKRYGQSQPLPFSALPGVRGVQEA